MNKKSILFIALFLLTSHLTANEEPIKDRGLEYASYDESIKEIICFSYQDNIYWKITYAKAGWETEYLILTGDGTPVYEEKTLDNLVLAQIIKEYNKSRVDEYKKITDACGKSLQSTKVISNNFELEDDATKVLNSLQDLIESYDKLKILSDENAITLNKSITLISPQDANQYIQQINKTIDELMNTIKYQKTAIQEINRWHNNAVNKTNNELAGESINYLNIEENNYEILKSNLIQEKNTILLHQKKVIEGIQKRIKSKQREPYTIPLLTLTIILVIVLVSILHLWR